MLSCAVCYFLDRHLIVSFTVLHACHTANVFRDLQVNMEETRLDKGPQLWVGFFFFLTITSDSEVRIQERSHMH